MKVRHSLLVFFAAATLCFAQSERGNITGVMTDASNAAVPSATGQGGQHGNQRDHERGGIFLGRVQRGEPGTRDLPAGGFDAGIPIRDRGQHHADRGSDRARGRAAPGGRRHADGRGAIAERASADRGCEDLHRRLEHAGGSACPWWWAARCAVRSTWCRRYRRRRAAPTWCWAADRAARSRRPSTASRSTRTGRAIHSKPPISRLRWKRSRNSPWTPTGTKQNFADSRQRRHRSRWGSAPGLNRHREGAPAWRGPRRGQAVPGFGGCADRRIATRPPATRRHSRECSEALSEPWAVRQARRAEHGTVPRRSHIVRDARDPAVGA